MWLSLQIITCKVTFVSITSARKDKKSIRRCEAKDESNHHQISVIVASFNPAHYVRYELPLATERLRLITRVIAVIAEE